MYPTIKHDYKIYFDLDSTLELSKEELETDEEYTSRLEWEKGVEERKKKHDLKVLELLESQVKTIKEKYNL